MKPERGRETCVQPDLLFVAHSRRHVVVENGVLDAPDLVIEILSESSYWADLENKLDLYRRVGASARRNTGSPIQFVKGDKLTTPLIPGLEIDLTTLFEPYE